MAVHGYYIERQVRLSAGYVKAYEKCVLEDVMPSFANLQDRADEKAHSEFERLGSESTGEDADGDMAEAAELAQEKGYSFYNTMCSLRQTALNLFTVGVFHLAEQQLVDLCLDTKFDLPRPRGTKLEEASKWYKHHLGLDMASLSSWPSMEELRLVANTVKHGEGRSAEELRKVRPTLFQRPSKWHFGPKTRDLTKRLRKPLASDDLYINEEIFLQYSQNTILFLEEIASHFNSRGMQYYPHD